MGAANSTLEEDQGLQLCRARKRFIKQALNGRCSLAAAHIAYIAELRSIGSALRRFVEPETQPEAFASPSTTSALVVSSQYQSHPMRIAGTVSTKVEEKPSVPVVISVSPEFSSAENPPDNTPWDYFGLFHHVEDDCSTEGRRMFDHGSECSDERDEEGMPEHEPTGEHEESEDEFDKPASASLVRSFTNVNTATKGASGGDSPTGSRVSAVNGESTAEQKEIVVSSTELAADDDGTNTTVSIVPLGNDVEATVVGGSEPEDDDAVEPKDFNTSIKDIEQLFVKASESGQEVPRMLEANKFHFRPVFPGRERRLAAASLLRSCFSCGEDPTQAQQEPSQNSVKYLTWPRSNSFRSSSSRNLLSTNSNEDTADPSRILFDNFCMVSGSHASTLDRLYAWEKKLYEEVKASEVVRSSFDQKCKILRQRESRGENTEKIRAAVKDLHSRISVAIHRINSISKRIEEIRDMELQPQLEELIEGLRRMWETMVECHRLQFHIISISHAPTTTKLRIQSDSDRHVTIHLGQNLTSFSSAFTKWITAQKAYVEAIEKWLLKCVPQTQKQPSKRNRRKPPPSFRDLGPPIYMICSAWLENIRGLPSADVEVSIRELAADVAQSLPLQDKNQDEAGPGSLRDDVGPRLDRVRASLGGFLAKLNGFAEASLGMFVDLQKDIQDAKKKYERFKSQRGEVLV